MRLVPLNIFKPSSNLFTDLSKVVLLLWILLLFMNHVCLYYTVLSVPCNLVITCWKRADLLVLLCVMFSCVFVTFPYSVSGKVWLLINRFLISAFFTFNMLFLFCIISMTFSCRGAVIHFYVYTDWLRYIIGRRKVQSDFGDHLLAYLMCAGSSESQVHHNVINTKI